MKATETFADFHTCFLHLAGQARIPKEDLQPDLFDKLTLELQWTVLPIYLTLQTVKELSDKCLSLDQGLRRLKARADRLKARNTPTPNAPTTQPNKPADHAATLPNPRTPQTGFTHPTYDDPRRQALSIWGACFSCGQEGHIARDCPLGGKGQILKV